MSRKLATVPPAFVTHPTFLRLGSTVGAKFPWRSGRGSWHASERRCNFPGLPVLRNTCRVLRPLQWVVRSEHTPPHDTAQRALVGQAGGSPAAPPSPGPQPPGPLSGRSRTAGRQTTPLLKSQCGQILSLQNHKPAAAAAAAARAGAVPGPGRRTAVSGRALRSWDGDRAMLGARDT